jgi:Ca2+-binding RTX toxin-like protein
VRIGRAGRILVDGEPCGAATVATTDRITGAGGKGRQRLVLDLRGGSFGEVAIEAELGGGRADRVALIGGPGGERHEANRRGLDLDPATGSAVALAGVDLLTVDTGRGADQVDAGPWQKRLRLAGGRGADALRGGRRGDRIAGGPGHDHLEGAGGGDRVEGGRGSDRCPGGAGTDALLSCTPPFDGTSSRLDAELRRKMTGRSWHRGCPVGLGRLRLLRVPHWTMRDRDVHTGSLVVHRDADRRILRAMRELLQARFEIRRMKLIDRYGGDDHRSMNADNTSAFNCRFVAGTSRWSEHAFGRAIDVNPVENPYVTPSGHVSPPAGRRYADRSRHAPGMVHRGDAAHRAFARVGWEWGGNWPGTKDYQHFSASGN